MTQQRPLASILMFTYNHAAYVEQALHSCLSQETNFPFEIIIGDDASTDGTQEIVRDFATKHPQIVLSLQPKNSAAGKSFIDAMRLVRGTYVAFCEGDDFWTVPYKLQKQVRFLEENPVFSVCCHKVEMQFEGTHAEAGKQFIYKDCNSKTQRVKDGIFYADEAIANYYFQTSSLCFRWIFKDGFPDWFEKRMLFDHYLFMLHAVEGKIKYFDESMSCWRRHMSGYSWLQTVDKGIFFQKELHDWLHVYSSMDDHFEKRFTWQIRERILLALREVVKNSFSTNQLEQARRLLGKDARREWRLCDMPLDEMSMLFIKHKEYVSFILDNAILVDAVRLLFPENKELFPPWASLPRAKAAGEALEGAEGASCEADTEAASGCSGLHAPYTREKGGLPTITVGDMLELDLNILPKPAKSVWDQWTAGQEYACFANFRAALSAYLWHNAITTLWLPSFLPPVVRELLPAIRVKHNIYHVNDDCSVATDFLKLAQPGEGVLSICYFGRATPRNLEKALLKRPDLFWIEDRAQALWPGKPSRANAAIYSPRKVLGVPDGGILVGKGAAAMQPAEEDNDSERAATAAVPLLARFESGSFSGATRVMRTVYTDYQAVSPAGGPSRLTLAMLSRIPLREVMRKRKENWATLYAALAPYALWAVPKPSFAPYGFPMRMPSSTLAMMAQTLLANKGYACTREWTQLPVSAQTSIGTERLAARILVLPCDHRYGSAEMQAMAGELLAIIHGNIGHAPRLAD